MFSVFYSLQYPLRLGRTLCKYDNFSILRKTIATTAVRSDVFNIGKRMRNEDFFKKRDQIDKSYELIYCAPFEYLTSMCKHVPTFSLVTVSTIIACKIAAGIEVIDPTAQFTLGPAMAEGGELIGFAVAFYVFNMTLLYGTSKYPLRIYKLKNKYIAMFEGYMPFSPKQFHFSKGDVGPTKSILPWAESIYKVKNKTVLVYSHHFKRPSDFNDMLRK